MAEEMWKVEGDKAIAAPVPKANRPLTLSLPGTGPLDLTPLLVVAAVAVPVGVLAAIAFWPYQKGGEETETKETEAEGESEE